ncbi:hypothetical protein CRG98_012531 [Punica granatum]|uniref:Uncharacterized protein n=1 Tax=Punica granatum TaxID=22663 RepID=A0A2I0KEZ5_PUNGR|nr:hypothetical protein CRG98_012531 [Punica granatum]
MVSVCRERAPKTCREAFVTIETSLRRKVDTPKPRDPKERDAGPDESLHSEDDSDRVFESRLDITRELERSNGHHETRLILASPIGLVGPDPRLLEPALL